MQSNPDIEKISREHIVKSLVEHRMDLKKAFRLSMFISVAHSTWMIMSQMQTLQHIISGKELDAGTLWRRQYMPAPAGEAEAAARAAARTARATC